MFVLRTAWFTGVSAEKMSDPDWLFADPENVLTFTVADIAFGRAPILRVCHDQDDGGWQFLTGGPLPGKEEWKLVLLKNVVKLDPTIAELASRPLGWEATRSAAGEKWITRPQTRMRIRPNK